MSQKSIKFYELEIFRGIAALSILLFHYTFRYGQIYGQHGKLLLNFSKGYYGVQLFLMISGFVILLTLNRTQKSIDFIVSRFSRLYPAYWSAVIFTTCCVLFFGLPNREVTLTQAVINLSMLQKWFNIPSVDGVYWTLAVELSFYIIMIILFALNLLQKIEKIIFLWLGIQLAAHFLTAQSNIFIPDVIRLSLLLDYANLFISGIFFFKIKNNGSTLLRNIGTAACLLTEYFVRGMEAFLAVVICYLLFYAFIGGWLKRLKFTPLIFLGTISYSLFLIHQNVGYIIMRYLYCTNLNANLVVIVTALLMMLVAVFFTFCIEKPAMSAFRNFYQVLKKSNQIKSHDSKTPINGIGPLHR